MDEQVNEKAATGFTKTIWVSKLDAFKDKIVHLNRILKKNNKPPLKVSYTNFRRIPVEFEFHMKGDAYRNDLFETRYVEVCDAVCTGLTEVKKDDKTYTYLGSVSCGEGGRQVFVKDETFKDYFKDKRNGFLETLKGIRDMADATKDAIPKECHAAIDLLLILIDKRITEYTWEAAK